MTLTRTTTDFPEPCQDCFALIPFCGTLSVRIFNLVLLLSIAIGESCPCSSWSLCHHLDHICRMGNSEEVPMPPVMIESYSGQCS